MSRRSVIRRTLRSSAATSMVALSAISFGLPAFAAGPPSEAAMSAFKRADANGDGKLSKEEAMKMPGIADKFDALDVNGDGFLSLSEFASAFDEKK
jgi:hypothetical protein